MNSFFALNSHFAYQEQRAKFVQALADDCKNAEEYFRRLGSADEKAGGFGSAVSEVVNAR